MTKEQLAALAAEFSERSPANRVPAERALRPDLAGMRMFGEPLAGFAAAEDEYLLSLRDTPGANLPLDPPRFWLPGAATVISLFLPFPEPVRASNRADNSWPSPEWMHARIDGQAFLEQLCAHLTEAIEGAGYRAVAPALDGRFWTVSAPREPGGPAYTSNWSERHVAYACGLGTFSLSRGLITRAGVAGRFCSLVTDLPLTPDERAYQGLEDYCAHCGACARNCPADAISAEGKRHSPCDDFLGRVRRENAPYYGCGKCQVGVPCEARAPVSERRTPMPTYDRGSAPIPKPKKDIPPAPKPFAAGEEDEPIVQCAKALDEAAQSAQAQKRTEGRQPGFTAASVEGVLEKSGQIPADHMPTEPDEK